VGRRGREEDVGVGEGVGSCWGGYGESSVLGEALLIERPATVCIKRVHVAIWGGSEGCSCGSDHDPFLRISRPLLDVHVSSTNNACPKGETVYSIDWATAE